MLQIRTILHPTDFSKQSEFAFRMACSLAKDYGAEMHVLHVMPPPHVGYIEGPMPIAPESLEDELRQKLNRLHAEDNTVRVLHRLVEGEPVDEILHMAKQTGCDLIVMGTHGRTGVGRVLLGSVAEGVVRKAPCPVLTIKNPLSEIRSTAMEAGEKTGRKLQTVEN
jgi:nucleotide-binding universal stress UspA family protein